MASGMDISGEIEAESVPSVSGERVVEGSADVCVGGHGTAFYNPAQQFNRDLTVTVLRQLSNEFHANAERESLKKSRVETTSKQKNALESPSGLRILDALSASGLRAIRFACEVPRVEKVIANDFSDTAVQLIKQNVQHNKVEHLVTCSQADANSVMFDHRQYGKQFHSIDLDPFGSPAHFLDAAVQAVSDNGILMVTCTDVAVLCGGHSPEACLAKYNAIPARAGYCHELGIRLALQSVDSHANRYGRYIEPLLCLSIDFYIRLFVRVKSGPAKVKDNVCKRSSVYVCSGCESFVLQPMVQKQVQGKSVKYVQAVAPTASARCQHCNSHYRIAGPIWSDPLFDVEFVQQILADLEATDAASRLATHERLFGMLTMAVEELNDAPLFYDLRKLCHTTKVPMPKQEIILSAFRNAHKRVAVSHCNPLSLKTDASAEFVWDVMRQLAVNTGVKPERHSETSPGYRILLQPITNQIDFTLHPEASAISKRRGLVRFQQNPGFGPKARNKGSVISTQAGMYNTDMKNRQRGQQADQKSQVSLNDEVSRETNGDIGHETKKIKLNESGDNTVPV